MTRARCAGPAGAASLAGMSTISSPRGHDPARPTAPRPLRPWAALLLAMAVMAVDVLGGVPPFLAVQAVSDDHRLAQLGAALGTSACSVLACWLWWRRSRRARGRGVFARSGVRPARPGAFLLGLLLALLVTSLATTVDGLLGNGRWTLPDLSRPSAVGILAALAVAWLLQGFPEEMVWRGQAALTLSRTWSPWAVVAASSAGFGLMHIPSSSGAHSWPERGINIVEATAFGLVLVACRVAGRSLWTAIGFHGGYDLVRKYTHTLTGSFTVWYLVLTAVLLCTAAVLLWWRPPTGTRAPAPA